MDGRFIPPPPSSLNQGSEMARFGFCAASSLTWEGGWGFAVPLYYVQDCNLFKKKLFCPRLKVLRAKLIINTGAHVLTPPYGKYLTHAHNQITLTVAAMDSCFSLIGATLSDLMRVLLLVFFFCRFIFVRNFAIFEAYLMNPLRFSAIF